MSKLRIVLAQQNFPVGAIVANTQKIMATIAHARDVLAADILLFPELALSGYPPEDLLVRADFLQHVEAALAEIIEHTAGIDVLLGYPEKKDGVLYNSVSVIRDGKVILNYRKQRLPNFGIFDEKRYFSTSPAPGVFQHKNICVGVIICQDLWHAEPVEATVKAGAQLLLCPNASPFEITKAAQREAVLRQRIAEQKVPILYCHGVSGQDDLVFDGGSLAMDAEQKICAQAGYFAEELLCVEIDAQTLQPVAQAIAPPLGIEEKVYQALVFSLREYVENNNFPGVLIGISGGIDSALVLAIAVDALGKDRVQGIILPSRYTSELSMQLATELLNNFAVVSQTISIENIFKSLLSSLEPILKDAPKDITAQNLQARCRGIMLMALSNQSGDMVLTTSNKSEVAVGYSTLYGDMVGGFAVLKDVYKTMVYRLVHYRNSINPQIPLAIIERPPTAELAFEQQDQDTLPPYAELDQILELYIEQGCSAQTISAKGFALDTVQRIIQLLHLSEYKRYQAAPGPRITGCAFGRERRYPITSGYKGF